MHKDPGTGDPVRPGRLTPAMAQYNSIKSQYPDSILFFHIGDFYETFGTDAETVSRELDIVLTSRSRDSAGNKIPLAGVPCHAADGYIGRLIEKGYRVAVCDQVEDSKNAKGIVKREVVRVVSPGMVMDESLLSSRGAHYLMALVPDQKAGQAGLAFLDISTGEFFVTVCPLDLSYSSVLSAVARYRPAECLVPESGPPELCALLTRSGVVLARRPDGLFDPDEGRRVLLAHFRVAGLEGFGLEGSGPAVRAAGAAIIYAREMQRSDLPQVTGLFTRLEKECCQLDAVTLRNLEILRNIREKGEEGTLISVIDRTLTPMGARMLRRWLCEPLLSVEAINRRLDAVEQLVANPAVRMEIARNLRRCADMERISGRIAYGNAGPRDLQSLRQTLAAVPVVKGIIGGEGSKTTAYLLGEACAMMSDLTWAASLIGDAVVDDPPATIRNGGVIREGHHPELDSLRAVARGGKEWMLELQQQEREKTGIRSLKVGYNSVFGYYIEVTKPNLNLVPPQYLRKQTTATGERFTIPELKEKEALIADADDRILSLEQEIFSCLLEQLQKTVPALQDTAKGLAMVDVLCSLAGVAESEHYCRPVVDESCEVLVREGRHPVVEQAMKGKFVQNDLQISCEGDQILIVTGANMAGKSTYMRAAALLVIMAQAGCFVPASYARVGLVDRVFSRVGAFDDLASGQSTFMVEMLELANILNHVSKKSLVILDEIGRGTSTLDGFCIARAVLEYLHGRGPKGPRTLFATHFHELVTVEADLSRVKNYHFAVKDSGSEVTFLRRIIPGATDRSYGIHVASLAGIPRRVTERAQALMDELAVRETMPGVKVKRYTQLLLMDAHESGAPPHPVIEELKNLSLDDMTPLSAISTLYDLQRKARDRED